MGLSLTDDQLLLRETAKTFLDDNSPVKRMRDLRDATDETGFTRALWKEMADLGWVGILLPESAGGSEMGHGDLGVVLEECGRVLAPEPFLSTVLLGAIAVQQGANETLQKEVLAAVATGDRVLAMALEERARFSPYAISTSATADGDGFVLSGEKRFVLDGHVADQIVLVARTSGNEGDRDGLSLFLVDAATNGVSVERTIMVDGRNAALVRFDNASVASDRLLGTLGEGADLLDAVLDRATVGLCSEMIGTLQTTFDRTLQYLKDRDQFGVKIGSFQALRHRAADMYAELEMARATVMDAWTAIDEGRDDIAQSASAAKARCSQAARLIGGEAIQMHGGIGMTDEEEIGLFFKRLKAAELAFGDATYHQRRFATLQGY